MFSMIQLKLIKKMGSTKSMLIQFYQKYHARFMLMNRIRNHTKTLLSFFLDHSLLCMIYNARFMFMNRNHTKKKKSFFPDHNLVLQCSQS